MNNLINAITFSRVHHARLLCVCLCSSDNDDDDDLERGKIGFYSLVPLMHPFHINGSDLNGTRRLEYEEVFLIFDD